MIERDEQVHLIDRFKKYFGYLNTGFKGKRYDVYPYNGGLFKPDEVLDHILIDDVLLYDHTLKLSEYNFESEVDVNILGHIFENSLTEIEEVEAELTGQQTEKTKSKRKKDGVFYTPKYITKYIVENTVGKLCEQKKAEFDITDENYQPAKQRSRKRIDNLQAYREWLLGITICDPACGSGAFLNQALEFLIAEHKYIDELSAKYNQDAFVLSEVENSILENNLFGVDINEESVQIAKLSLWLRTAQKNRKLNDLSNNIKCGNSLIDDPEFAGDKAFKWEEEFKTVFDDGGFDVVIGNPPYVNANDVKKFSPPEEFHFLKSNYQTAKGTVDLYIYFFEKGLKILNSKGILSYITPNRFLSASYGKTLREYIISTFQLVSIVDYSDKIVFSDASTYPVITTIKNQIDTKYDIQTGKFDEDTKELILRKFPSSKLDIMNDSILGFLLNDKLAISEKIIEKSILLENAGLINATSTAKEADEYSELINEESGYKLINTGTIDPYLTTWGHSYLTDKGKKYLTPFLPSDSLRISKNRNKLYSSPKIIISKIGLQCEAFYDRNGIYASINTNCIHSFRNNFLPEYVLCWLNSKLYNYLFECLFDGLRMAGGYLLFSAPNLKNTYIFDAPSLIQNKFIDKAHSISNHKMSLIENSQKFLRSLNRNFEIEKLPRKLETWHELSFANFVNELKKKKVVLTLTQQAEWEDYFLQEQQKANALKTEINRLDAEIDALVYKLYGLTEEEIAIVEGS